MPPKQALSQHRLTLVLLGLRKAKFREIDSARGWIMFGEVLELTTEVRSRVVEPGEDRQRQRGVALGEAPGRELTS